MNGARTNRDHCQGKSLAGTPFDLPQVDGTNGVVFEGVSAFDRAGSSVAGSGDVNGDGLADILIGAPQADVGGDDEAGEGYLVYGKQGGLDHVGGVFSLASSYLQTNGRGLTFLGEAQHDFAGASVSIVGDRNGDGYDDLLVGAPGADDTGKADAGKTYLIGGSASMTGGDLGTVGTPLVGEAAGDAFGHSVSGAGDVSDQVDGLGDLLVGAAKASPDSNDEAGTFYLLKGIGGSPPASSTYKARTAAGDAPRTAVGAVESAMPSSRCWIDFAGGTGSGYQNASQETVIVTRNNTGISGLSNVATVRWELQTTRSNWNSARVTFKYLNAEVSGLTESDLRLYQSSSLTSGWTLLDGQSLDPQINEISGTITSLSPKYFAIAATGAGGLQTIHVYPGAGTIQQAIDDVASGGTVIVHPGTYLENLALNGKNLVLQSVAPTNPAVRDATIIDGQALGPVILLNGNEPSSTIIEGLAITNGLSNVGGGIASAGNPGSAATIRYNRIRSNQANQGGGVFNLSGTFTYNVVDSNSASEYGGGLAWCQGVISHNLIFNNKAEQDGGGLSTCVALIDSNLIRENSSEDFGGGISYGFGTFQNNIISFNSSATHGGGIARCNASFLNNTIYGNYAIDNGGLSNCRSDFHPGIGEDPMASSVIRNCVVWGNRVESFNPQIDTISVQPDHSCIEGWSGGGTGNIASDPLLLFPENNKFQPEPGSPCVNAGASVAFSADFDGDIRNYGGAVDIGAEEFLGGTIPARPTGLEISFPADETTCILNWDDNDPAPIQGYNIYRATSVDGPYFKVNLNTVTASEYIDTGLNPNRVYYYCVTARGSESGRSGVNRRGVAGYAIGCIGTTFPSTHNNTFISRAQHYRNWAIVNTGKGLIDALKNWSGPDKPKIDRLFIFSHGVTPETYPPVVAMNNGEGFYMVETGLGANNRDILDLYDELDEPVPQNNAIQFSDHPIIVFTGCALGKENNVGPPLNITEYSFGYHVAEVIRGSYVYVATGQSSDEGGNENGWFRSDITPWRVFRNTGNIGYTPHPSPGNAAEVQQPWLRPHQELPANALEMTAPSATRTNKYNLLKVW